MSLRIVLACSVVALSSCAGVPPSSLRPVTADKSIVLGRSVDYDEYYSLAGVRFFLTINAGRYAAKYEDASGTYFEGPGECFTIRFENDSLKKEGKAHPAPHSYRCGIHVPVGAGGEPRLYFYRDPEESKAIFGGTQVQVVDAKGVPSASPAAAVGGAIGMSLVEALDAAELKNLHFYRDQPKPGQIRKAMEGDVPLSVEP